MLSEQVPLRRRPLLSWKAAGATAQVRPKPTLTVEPRLGIRIDGANGRDVVVPADTAGLP